LVLTPAGGVACSRYHGRLQVGFVGASGILRGPEGREWTLVEYRVNLGYWVTVHQLSAEGLSAALAHQYRSDVRWLRPLPLLKR
jgi:hypothetical protein